MVINTNNSFQFWKKLHSAKSSPTGKAIGLEHLSIVLSMQVFECPRLGTTGHAFHGNKDMFYYILQTCLHLRLSPGK